MAEQHDSTETGLSYTESGHKRSSWTMAIRRWMWQVCHRKVIFSLSLPLKSSEPY